MVSLEPMLGPKSSDPVANTLGPKAGDALEGFVPMLKITKKTTETRSTITKSDDAEIKLHMDAQHTYVFWLFLSHNASVAGDLAFTFTVPAGAVFSAAAVTQVAGVTIAFFAGNGANISMDGVALDNMLPVQILVINGAVPGDLALNWAQIVASGNTSVLAGATMFGWQVT